ncbi:hypothetical protein J3R82DRAFT_6195 [Butyriboletus roseoflavus]|nr:hypothetical protein J3R82DRAFT_6195 [Butyriboletus roseoflavus]
MHVLGSRTYENMQTHISPASSSATRSISVTPRITALPPPFPSSTHGHSVIAPTAHKQRQVTTEEAAQWAEQEGLLFVEASAKSGQNVERAFEAASRDILDKIQRGVFDDDRRPSFPSPDPVVPSPHAVTWREAVQTGKWKCGT